MDGFALLDVLPFLLSPFGHEGLEDGEEDAAVLGDLPLLADLIGRDAHQGILGKGREVAEGLVREDVAVGQEQDARTATGLPPGAPVGEVPAAMEELPGDLEGDEGLARAGRQGEQDAVPPLGHGLKHLLHGQVLIVAPGEGTALVFVGNGGEAVAPSVLGGESRLPQLLRRREALAFAFLPRAPVDAVDPLAIGGIGEAHIQLLRIHLGLAHPFGQGLVPGLGLDHRELGTSVFQDIVGRQCRAALASSLQPPLGDRVFPPDPTALDHTPSGLRQGGIDVFGTGFGFVHGPSLEEHALRIRKASR